MEGNIIVNNIASLKIDDDDRISELPDFIAHHILSFLVDDPAELIRTSVLSKRWFDITASFPILDFDDQEFLSGEHLPRPYDPVYRKDMFFKYVEYTTSRFSQQQNVVNATTFKFRAELKDPAHADIVDRCLGLILKQGLQEFVIGNRGYSVQPPPIYRLPNVLLSLSSLTSMRIHCCELPSSLTVDDDVVKFKSLKVLHIYGVYLNEDMIKRLTVGCPRLEIFNVKRCYGFKRICVYGLQNLQNAAFDYTSEVEEIDIQAPNLVYVHLFQMSKGEKPPCVNLFSCQKLLMNFVGWFSEQFSVSLPNFLFLETLMLKLDDKYKIFKLSSHSLRKLSLVTKSDLDEIKIDTPNLLYFQYDACSNVQLQIRDSDESETCMDCRTHFGADTRWFQKFRRFLERTIPFKVLKLDGIPHLIDVKKLKLLESSPFELEHIELFVNSYGTLSEYLSLVDAVLWCCHPRSFALRSYSSFDDLQKRNHLVKFTCEKLLEQEEEGQTNIQIVFSTVKAFRRSNDHLITFFKQEVGQEAGL